MNWTKETEDIIESIWKKKEKHQKDWIWQIFREENEEVIEKGSEQEVCGYDRLLDDTEKIGKQKHVDEVEPCVCEGWKEIVEKFHREEIGVDLTIE